MRISGGNVLIVCATLVVGLVSWSQPSIAKKMHGTAHQTQRHPKLLDPATLPIEWTHILPDWCTVDGPWDYGYLHCLVRSL